jgi:hypothetical protein
MPRILNPLAAVPLKEPPPQTQDDVALLRRIQGVLQRGTVVVRALSAQGLAVTGDLTVQGRLVAAVLSTAGGVSVARLPRGRLGGFETSSGSSGFTAETALGVSYTVTVAAGRRLRVVGKAIFASTVAGDIVQLNIKEGSTFLDQSNWPVVTANGSTSAVGIASLASVSAGVHTYALTASRVAGTGTITMIAGATYQAAIEIDDVGAV